MTPPQGAAVDANPQTPGTTGPIEWPASDLSDEAIVADDSGAHFVSEAASTPSPFSASVVAPFIPPFARAGSDAAEHTDAASADTVQNATEQPDSFSDHVASRAGEVSAGDIPATDIPATDIPATSPTFPSFLQPVTSSEPAREATSTPSWFALREPEQAPLLNAEPEPALTADTPSVGDTTSSIGALLRQTQEPIAAATTPSWSASASQPALLEPLEALPEVAHTDAVANHSVPTPTPAAPTLHSVPTGPATDDEIKALFGDTPIPPRREGYENVPSAVPAGSSVTTATSDRFQPSIDREETGELASTEVGAPAAVWNANPTSALDVTSDQHVGNDEQDSRQKNKQDKAKRGKDKADKKPKKGLFGKKAAAASALPNEEPFGVIPSIPTIPTSPEIEQPTIPQPVALLPETNEHASSAEYMTTATEPYATDPYATDPYAPTLTEPTDVPAGEWSSPFGLGTGADPGREQSAKKTKTKAKTKARAKGDDASANTGGLFSKVDRSTEKRSGSSPLIRSAAIVSLLAGLGLLGFLLLGGDKKPAPLPAPTVTVAPSTVPADGSAPITSPSTDSPVSTVSGDVTATTVDDFFQPPQDFFVEGGDFGVDEE